MGLAIQFASRDKSIRKKNNTSLKRLVKSEPILTQAKRGNDSVAMLPVFKNVFIILGDKNLQMDKEIDFFFKKMSNMIENGSHKKNKHLKN